MNLKKNPISSVVEEQPTPEDEVSHGSTEQRLTDLHVVSAEEVTRISVEQTKIVAEGSRSANSGGSNIVLSYFFGQTTNFLDDSGIQRLIEDDPAEFQAILEEGDAAIRSEQTFG